MLFILLDDVASAETGSGLSLYFASGELTSQWMIYKSRSPPSEKILSEIFDTQLSRQFTTTSAEVTPNGSLVREVSPKMAETIRLRIYFINCPELYDEILLMAEILHHLGWLKPYK